MKRLIINGLSLLSFALCVATLALWVRSHWVCDVLEWKRIEAAPKSLADTESLSAVFGYQVHSGGGQLSFARQQYTPYGNLGPPITDAELMESVGLQTGFSLQKDPDYAGSAKQYG